MEDKKRGGCNPALLQQCDGLFAVQSSEKSKAVTPALTAIHGSDTSEPTTQYSIDAPRKQCYATIPNGVQWLTPEREHTQDAPWCANLACFCHFDNAHMERHFIGPITQGILSIAEAIDLYHCEPEYMKRKMDEAMEREGLVLV